MLRISAADIEREIERAFYGAKIEVVNGKNERFMVLIDYMKRAFVIESDGSMSVGISEIRTEADNWLGGHEVVIDNPELDCVLEKLRGCISQTK